MAQKINLGPRQIELAEEIQRDVGYLSHLHDEIEAVKERIAKNKGKLEFIAEFAEKYGEPEPPSGPVPRGKDRGKAEEPTPSA